MSDGKNRRVLFKALDLAGLAVLLSAAFILSFKAGQRGFFALDQSYHFDGAYRILCGQIPFKDFFTVVGPMTFWLHAIPFKIFGVNYFAYLFGAAFMNLLAVSVAVAILRLYFPDRKFLSYLGGFLTAIWFYPPFGTPVYEQTAMIFSLLAILFTTSALVPENVSSAKSRFYLILAGIMLTAAFLSKQSVVFLFPVFFLLIWAADFGRERHCFQKTLMLMGGLIGSLAVFIGWLWMYSDLRSFAYFFLNLPSSMGSDRLGKCFETYLAFRGVGSPDLQQAMHIALAASIAAIVLYSGYVRTLKAVWRRTFLASILCLYGIFFQYVFICSTCNEPEVACALAGLIFALGAGILLETLESAAIVLVPVDSTEFPVNKAVVKIVLAVIVFAGAFGLARSGVEVAFSRSVHGVDRNAKFQKSLPIESLKELKWRQPTQIRNELVKEEDFVRVYEYLKRKDQNFFIFTDFTILYGLLGKPSPQPLLAFNRGETYPFKYNPAIDRQIVEALKKNNVQIVVVEKVNFLGARLDEFPLLRKFILNDFSETQKFGIFSIREKKTGTEAGIFPELLTGKAR